MRLVGTTLAVLLSTSSGFADVVFTDFSDPAGLRLIGDVAVTDELALTPFESTSGEAVAAWFETPQSILLGFETVFEFRITERRLRPAGSSSWKCCRVNAQVRSKLQ